MYDSIIELVIFMKVEFAKTRRDYRHRLTYDDTIGKREETLDYKKRKLEELADTIRRNNREYRTAASERLLS